MMLAQKSINVDLTVAVISVETCKQALVQVLPLLLLDFLSVSMRHMRLTHRGEEMLLFLVTSVSSFVLCDLPECFDESVFALCNNE